MRKNSSLQYLLRFIFHIVLVGAFLFSCTDNSPKESLPLTSRIRSFETRGLYNQKMSPKAFVSDIVRKGYNVITYGAIYGTGYTLVKNSVLPLHPGANPDWLPKVIKEAHQKDVKVNCWMCFNIQDVRTDKSQYIIDSLYPEYKMHFLEGECDECSGQTGMCMITSPYIGKYKTLVKEVAALGSDGIWFDGFYYSGLPDPSKPGCTCKYCRERFRKETGLELPGKIDWNSLAFKKWVRWRNERLYQVAEELTDIIHQVNPDCKVTFNTNTWPFMKKDWETGVPLWKTDKFGVSQHAFYFQPGMRWMMLGYKARLSHDMNPNHSDIWQWAAPGFHTGNEAHDSVMNFNYMALHSYAGLTYGTAAWRAGDNPEFAKKINKALADPEKYFQTKQMKNMGVLVSQNTHDFWGHLPNTENLNTYRNSVLGTWLLLTENHVQFEFIFDNQLEQGKIDDYNIIVLPNTACLSEAQITALKKYVNAGGKLITTANVATYDEWADQKIDADRLIAQSTYFETDPGNEYLKNSQSPVAKEFLAVARENEEPLITIKAPPYVVSNAFTGDDGYLYIHLLNVKSFYDQNNHSGFRGLGMQDKAGDKRYHPSQYIHVDMSIELREEMKVQALIPDDSNISMHGNNTIELTGMGFHQLIVVEINHQKPEE